MSEPVFSTRCFELRLDPCGRPIVAPRPGVALAWAPAEPPSAKPLTRKEPTWSIPA